MKISKRDLEAIRSLIDLIGEDGIQEIEVERRFLGGGRVRISKGHQQIISPLQASLPVMSNSNPPIGDILESEETESRGSEDGFHPVQSPMVGMFYRSPSPDSPPFVEEGDVVSPGQTLCIIEAMKIMNEIEAEVRGRVVRVLIENEKPVEYNTPLFLLEPV